MDCSPITHNIATQARPKRVTFAKSAVVIPDSPTSLILHPQFSDLGRRMNRYIAASVTFVPVGRSLSETDLWIVNRILNSHPDVDDQTQIPVWAPPPCTPEDGFGEPFLVVPPNPESRSSAEETLMIPSGNNLSLPFVPHTIHHNLDYFAQDPGILRWTRLAMDSLSTPLCFPVNITDDQGETNSALDGVDDEMLALNAMSHDKSFRESFGPYSEDEEEILRMAGVDLSPYKPKSWIHSHKAVVRSFTAAPRPRTMTQANPGRPVTDRRPQQRPLLDDPQSMVDDWFNKSGITIGPMADTPERQALVRRLCYTWHDCFVESLNDIRSTDLVEHSIVVDESIKPFRLKQPRYTPDERKFANRVYPQMERVGLIYPGLDKWGAYSQFPLKKNGDRRIVQNYRPVNFATIKPQWPVHNRDGVFNTLSQGEHKIFSQSDASHGYWSVGTRRIDQPKTSFIGPNGQWFNTRMPQGMAGSAHTYCALSDLGFGEWPLFDEAGTQGPALPMLMGHHPGWGISFDVFIDDHNISAKSFDEMFDFLHCHYFPRLDFIPISIAPKKTFLFADSVEALGFELSQGKIRPSSKHRNRFENWSLIENHPKNQKELEEFLYLTPYLRVYIPGRTDLVGILKDAYTELVQKETPSGKKSVQRKAVPKPFSWGEAQKQAFTTICHEIQERAIKNPDVNRQYHLAVDASLTGAGGILFQLADQPVGTAVTDTLMPSVNILMFLSFKFSDAETRYTTGEREALGIVRCLAECRWMVIESPHPIMLYTDHLNLLQVFSVGADVRGRISTWIERLGEYQFIVHHRPNTTKIIKIADGFSRLTGPACQPATRFDAEKLPFTISAVGQVQKRSPGQPNPRPVHVLPFSGLSDSGGSTVNVAEAERILKSLAKPYAETKWYGDLVRYLILGPEFAKQFTANQRRSLVRDVVKYRIVDNFLFRLESDGDIAECILPDEVDLALSWAHDGHGHYAAAVTLKNLIHNFWWPTRYLDVVRHYRRCYICGETGSKLPSIVEPRRVVSMEPWDLVGMDFIGPFAPAGANGAKYILVVADYFARFAFGVAVNEASWFSVLKFWEFLYGIFGCPRQVYADNGSHFKHPLVKAFFDHRGSKLTHGPVYSGQSHGMIERIVRLITTQLRKWASSVGYEGLNRWPGALPKIFTEINSRVMKDCNLSPSQVMFGWKMRPTAEILGHDDPVITVDESGREERYVGQREEYRSTMRGFLVDRDTCQGSSTTHGYQKKDWVWEYVKDRDRRIRQFRRNGPGPDLNDDSRAPKLLPTWIGPLEIYRVVSDVSVEVVDPIKKSKPRKVHVNNLKRFEQDIPPGTVYQRGSTTTGRMEEILMETTDPSIPYPSEEGKEVDLRPQIREPRGNL